MEEEGDIEYLHGVSLMQEILNYCWTLQVEEPRAPVVALEGHRGEVNDLAWSETDPCKVSHTKPCLHSLLAVFSKPTRRKRKVWKHHS